MFIICRFVAGHWQEMVVDQRDLDHLREEIEAKQVRIMGT
jgi:hypothetical protein